MKDQRIVVENTNIVDTVNLLIKENQTLVIESGKFTWIGDEGSFDFQDTDRIVSGEGKYAIPGLMDLHTHLSSIHSMMQEWEKLTMRYKEPYWLFMGLKNAQKYLRYGFTTVRGCGENIGMSSLRTIFNEGKMVGPRLKLALEPIGQPGNQELFGPDRYIKANKELLPVSGVDGIIHAVRERKMSGSDHIKTTTTGGVLHGQESKVDRSLWRAEELEAMVSEAERLGMYVCSHAHADVGISSAVRAGVRSIEHSTMLSEDTIKEMKKRGTFIVGTLSAGTFIKNASETEKKNFHPEIIEKWETVSAKMVESHQLAFQKGVPIALGTDAPVAGEHCHSARELRLLVKELGMTPLQAIQAGTITAAKVIRMEDQLGSIEINKLADLVLLNKNPQDDITIFEDLQNINTVFKEGRIVAENGRIKHNY